MYNCFIVTKRKRVIMHKRILRSLLSILLCFALAFSVSLTFISCSMAGNSDSTDADNGENGNVPNPPESTDENSDYHSKIKVPEYKDYGRDTVNFGDIKYERPNYAAAIASFANVIADIDANAISYDEQLDAITSLEESYANILTMYSLANIYNSKNTAEKFWNDEYAFVTSGYPAFAEAIEDLFVAAANSPHAEAFEKDYFGDGLIEEYKDGGKFTENMIKFWEEEEALEAEYSSLSVDSFKISYNGVTDTVENLLSFYADKYGESSREYLSHSSMIISNYQERLKSEQLRIFIELVKIRKNIAGELGDDTYLNHGYEALSRDYSSAEASKFLDDIAKYVVPVYQLLSLSVFIPYFYPAGVEKESLKSTELSLDELINGGYELISEIDDKLADIYAYMLQHRLYDVELYENNRMDGAFTTYLENYNAPFLFISAGGNIGDYSTLFHEFGHFADAYINYNSDTSIDQKEISSQALEYITLLRMDGKLSNKDQLYLKYSMTWSALETLVIQGFYAKAEELIYALDYNAITESNINAQVKNAAKKFELNANSIDISMLLGVQHLFLYPFYVQSYAVSVAPALEIYFMELEEKGTGLEAYLELIDRNDEDMTLVESIKDAGITSPFKKNYLRDLANKIYNSILGKNYYEDNNIQNDPNAA